jgi:hypothetical protein
MDGLLLAISFRDLGAGARGCLIVAVLVCALLCPPLVLFLLCTLTLLVDAAAAAYLRASAIGSPQHAYVYRLALRGPPAR